MENNISSIANADVMNGEASTVDSANNSSAELNKLEKELSLLRDEFFYLMNRLCNLEEENRRLKENCDIQHLKSTVDYLNSMMNNYVVKLNDMHNFIDEMSRDYVNNYVTASVE